jgi:hypothetical protein
MSNAQRRTTRDILDSILNTIQGAEREVSGRAGQAAIGSRQSAAMKDFMDKLKNGEKATQPFGMGREIDPSEPRMIADILPRWYEGGTSLQRDQGRVLWNGWDVTEKFNKDKAGSLGYLGSEFGYEKYRYVPENWGSIIGNDLGHTIPMLVKRAAKKVSGNAGLVQEKYRTLSKYGDYEVAEGRKSLAQGGAATAGILKIAKDWSDSQKEKSK